MNIFFFAVKSLKPTIRPQQTMIFSVYLTNRSRRIQMTGQQIILSLGIYFGTVYFRCAMQYAACLLFTFFRYSESDENNSVGSNKSADNGKVGSNKSTDNENNSNDKVSESSSNSDDANPQSFLKKGIICYDSIFAPPMHGLCFLLSYFISPYARVRYCIQFYRDNFAEFSCVC